MAQDYHHGVRVVEVNEGSHTFVTHETFVRSIATPKESNPVQPHPMKSGQVALSL